MIILNLLFLITLFLTAGSLLPTVNEKFR